MFTSEALLALLLCFLVSAGVSRLVSRRVGLEVRKRHHEIGIAVFLQIGVIYAVLLAFVFNEVWDQFNVAANSVDRECSDLLGIAERAGNLPGPDQIRLRTEVALYLRLEIDKEWPAMQHRRQSGEAARAFSTLYNDIERVVPADATIVAARDRMMSLAGDIHIQRQERLFQLRSNVPPFLWGLLMADAAVLVLFVVLGGIEHHAVQLGMVGVFATFLCGILLTIHLLDYPFEGTISISDRPIRESQQQVQRLLHGEPVSE